MSNISESSIRAVHDLLARELFQCGYERITGALHVVGNPGGVFHLRHGSVVAVDTPGAPGVGALLVRSGRVSEVDWTIALQAEAAGQWPEAELVARGLLGSAELRVMCMMAVQDAIFAIVAGTMEGYSVSGESAGAALPSVQGTDPGGLLQDAARRLDALAALPRTVSPNRERVLPVPGADRLVAPLMTGRRKILSFANGRRSARDIAFMAGRGVYAVTVEISRMLSEGLLEIVSVSDATGGSLPGRTALIPVPRGPENAPAPEAAHASMDQLPRRHPGSSGINEFLDATRPTSNWKGFLRIRNRVRAAEPKNPTS
jgi:hypothetical protein